MSHRQKKKKKLRGGLRPTLSDSVDESCIFELFSGCVLMRGG